MSVLQSIKRWWTKPYVERPQTPKSKPLAPWIKISKTGRPYVETEVLVERMLKRNEKRRT